MSNSTPKAQRLIQKMLMVLSELQSEYAFDPRSDSAQGAAHAACDMIAEATQYLNSKDAPELTSKASLTEQAVSQLIRNERLQSLAAAERMLREYHQTLKEPATISEVSLMARELQQARALIASLKDQLAEQVAANENMVREKDQLSVELATLKADEKENWTSWCSCKLFNPYDLETSDGYCRQCGMKRCYGIYGDR